MAGKRSPEMTKKLDTGCKAVLKLAKRKSGVTPAEVMETLGVDSVENYVYRQVLKQAKSAGLQVTQGRNANYHL